MPIDHQILNKIAHLARLPLSDDEKPRHQMALNQLLEVFAALNCVDTRTIEPMAHPLTLSQRLRPDEVTEPNQREILQAHAPQIEQGLFVVPKVIEGAR